eukprot:CAMPEP_0174715378 /NCGR_PEP_ID=MMETSP1094-20130205/21182_1 /TAXON_ID=156173 /ORGANISM="Chrysochromulina brevifilum, Strain UTEX LB 985" /LENGTH=170 /DNA_ID=CAMNT_0015914941 /DNA_START=362 /DNA_END=872 /DNA_ORIENTATION=+
MTHWPQPRAASPWAAVAGSLAILGYGFAFTPLALEQVPLCICFDAAAMHLPVFPLPHVLAVGSPRVRSKAVDSPIVYLANVFVSNFPGVHAQPVHPPILPLTLELVPARKAVCAAATLQPILPVSLVAAVVRINADTDTVQPAVLNVAGVLALHCRADGLPRGASAWMTE